MSDAAAGRATDASGASGAVTDADEAAGPEGALAVSVHGPAGVLDLVVPAVATAGDVVREYVAGAGQDGATTAQLVLCDRRGTPLPPETALEAAGVGTGALLVAAAAPTGSCPESAAPGPEPVDKPTAVATLWCWLAGGAGLVGGWLAAAAEPDPRMLVVGLLSAIALVSALPVGRLAAPRTVAAPLFGAAAALAITADTATASGPLRTTMVAGLMGLAVAVTAGFGRALAPETDGREYDVRDPLTVQMVAGVLVFAVAGIGAVVGAQPQAVWAVLLLVAMLAARFVPDFAIDVPDEALVDIDRLAVSAWSARGRPTARRTRLVVPERAVVMLVDRASRIVTAAAAACLVVALVAAPGLAVTAAMTPDRWGAWAELLFVGGGLLLAARSYRHALARRLLRAAGLVCWVVLSVEVMTVWSGGRLATVTAAGITIGLLCVAAAVATGRGWRSAWWSRRAEVGESVAGAFAIASLVVATGFFRFLWEIKS